MLATQLCCASLLMPMGSVCVLRQPLAYLLVRHGALQPGQRTGAGQHRRCAPSKVGAAQRRNMWRGSAEACQGRLPGCNEQNEGPTRCGAVCSSDERGYCWHEAPGRAPPTETAVPLWAPCTAGTMPPPSGFSQKREQLEVTEEVCLHEPPVPAHLPVLAVLGAIAKVSNFIDHLQELMYV